MGTATFAQHSLLARHLVENGAPFVMVLERHALGLSRVESRNSSDAGPRIGTTSFFHLINDLEQRSMLENTLVIAMGEFGRTPWINEARGRDHYPNAWSLAMAGCGIKPGVVFGATDKDGVDVADKPGRPTTLVLPRSSPPWDSTRTPSTTCQVCRSSSAWKMRRNRSMKSWCNLSVDPH